ncbi:MAG: HAD family phosphatase [Gammaproteobacteria bacterium]|nr:HAD family phosphatase [Gammaproteobacteria bacterium]MDH3449192.1 HAD family phosphatase [Gammaproteobacteria bacterium]
MTGALDLVIFDCDGVLVDSERIANQVFARALREVCGLEFTLEDMFDTFVGHSRAQCLQKIEAMIGYPPPPELDRRYQEEIDLALASSIEAIAGIEAVLEGLSLPCCVASSGSHEKMRLTLGKTGLIDFFDGNIFSTSDVERGKPHPDIYLHAAATMGFTDPARCLVIEDSPIGVSGAVAAGMRVYGFAELMPAHKLHAAGAHHVFERMRDLPDLIAGLP